MARRRRALTTAVSLFPFLSILACVIGVLTLIIAGLTYGEMAGSATGKRVEHERLTAGAAAAKPEADRLARLIAEAVALEAQLRQAREELQRLRIQAAGTPVNEREVLELAEKIRQLRLRIQELEAELKRLLEEIKDLESRAQGGREGTIVVGPGGTGTNLSPTFVECTAGALVIHPGETRIRTADVDSSTTFRSLMDEVSRRTNGTLIFLIRPDGVGTFDAVRRIVRQRGVRHGKLPLPGQGKVDLSRFGVKP